MLHSTRNPSIDDNYDFDDAYQSEGIPVETQPLPAPVFNQDDQEDDFQEDDFLEVSSKIDSQGAQSALGSLVAEYESVANDYLSQLGLPMCAGIWAKKGKGGMSKADRDRIYEKLVAMRDQSPELCKITGDCAYFLNSKYILSMAWDIYYKNKGKGSPLDMVQTIFSEFWSFNTLQWPKFDPARGSYTNFLTQGKHKVSHNSKDMPIQLDSNKQYQFAQLRKAEIEIMSEMETEATFVDNLTLHRKTNYPMTAIEAYRAWSNARNPVELDQNIQSAKSSAPTSRHTMQPDDAAVDTELVELIRSRVRDNLRSLPPEKQQIILMKLGITDFGSLKNRAIADIMHVSVGDINSLWTRAKHKLKNDPEIQQWFGQRPEKTKPLKENKTERTSEDYVVDSDEQVFIASEKINEIFDELMKN